MEFEKNTKKLPRRRFNSELRQIYNLNDNI